MKNGENQVTSEHRESLDIFVGGHRFGTVGIG